MVSDKLPYKVSRDGITALRSYVESYLDRRIVTPTDYDYLSLIIQERTRKSVSATTLKRVWGYVRDNGEEYKPGRYTASALAALVGFRDYEAFINAYNEGEIQSATYEGESLESSDLEAGELVELQWTPGRRCLLKYMGGGRFSVAETQNSKLRVGDEVECAIFMQRAPLYFSRVIRAGEPDRTYIAGARTGIRWQLLTPKG